ncbi:transcriptional regulator [Rhodococcus sp. ACPA4]|uniref:MarR family winged helix-turn-helix transcriptional regulator n=1 Tax=unclassified Rhodococcus (in: high G+C Gram-positive bacteria) TaxID=192944 RepID=UPI0005D35358|nr:MULTISPECIES: MarR family transcriptional regulator [unclassified Rhodococcus (in: high G+C Gram-positive bacteria)]KJF19178.1 transcriptional regulator [Rhodococcus sp. AD45]PBC35856.1 transcriptional regulator [Rhodococcus sp. ACPA4]ROZ42831.1 MarR family transcriptional regulator [Rhodococcus sp. WS3]RZL20594.1 MAG: MarR family transcriptional regulator [Rhodococcus sp. (in: high G+C Gram-positive bacteria)]
MTAEVSITDCDAVDDGVDRIEQAWARERPDIDVSSVGIVTRIWRIARYLERERIERLTELGTDRVTLDVLAMLRRSGKPYRMTAGRLSEGALITPGGISNRLDKLERSGLLKRSFHPKDRRRVDVQLTKKGVQLVDEVAADVMDHDSQLLARLGADDQAELRRLLKLLLTQFENPDEGSAAN